MLVLSEAIHAEVPNNPPASLCSRLDMCIRYKYNTHRLKGTGREVAMKPEKRARKQFILPVAKIKKARKILSAETDTETVERALDLVIADGEIRRVLFSVKGSCNIEDVYGRLAR